MTHHHKSLSAPLTALAWCLHPQWVSRVWELLFSCHKGTIKCVLSSLQNQVIYFPPGDPQFVPGETNFVVRYTWEIRSNEDGVERIH